MSEISPVRKFCEKFNPFRFYLCAKKKGIMPKYTKPLLKLSDVMPLKKGSRKDSVKERRERNLQGKDYDIALLSECARSWNNKEDPRKERARILRYLFGNQWGDYIHVHGLGNVTEEMLIKEQGNVPLKNNVMVSLWMSVFGVHAKQEMEPVCYARTEDAKALSDMLSSALQANWQDTFMAEKLDMAFAEYLISGMAFMRESYEERDEIHDSYSDYINPYYMFWEGGNDPTHQDIRMIGCLHDISPEDLYFRFARPEYNLTIDDLNEIYAIGEMYQQMQRSTSQQENEKNDYDNLSFYRPSDLGLCRVIEVWRQEVKPRYQLFDPLATDQLEKYFRCEKEDLPYYLNINKQRMAMYEEQGVPVEERAYITAREIVDKYWQYYFMAPNGRILCEGETPYDHKSHPFTVSLFPYVNGETHPFMGFFLDQQRYINRTVMMGDMAMKNAAKGMTFLPLSMKPKGMTIEQYANQKSKFDSVFVYDDVSPGALKSQRKPEFYTHSAFNIGQTDMLQLQLNMIHEVSGVSGALQGKAPTSGTSAARYAMESQNSTTTIYPLIKKFNGFEERCALKKLITMQQFYEEGRNVTPKGDDKQVFYRANACRNIKARISIKNSASSAAFLQLGNEMLDRLFDRGVLDPRIYLKYYDAPYTEKLSQDLDSYMNQLQQGQQPQQPVQVPGANQGQAALASQLMQGGGQLFTRTAPELPLQPAA